MKNGKKLLDFTPTLKGDPIIFYLYFQGEIFLMKIRPDLINLRKSKNH